MVEGGMLVRRVLRGCARIRTTSSAFFFAFLEVAVITEMDNDVFIFFETYIPVANNRGRQQGGEHRLLKNGWYLYVLGSVEA